MARFKFLRTFLICEFNKWQNASYSNHRKNFEETPCFHTYVFLPDGSRERPYFKQRFKITIARFRAPIASCFCVYWGENMSMYLLAIKA